MQASAASTGDQIFLNAGGDAGVMVGDRFDVFSVGEAMVDPDSGANLGAEKTKVGTVKIEKAQPKFAIGKLEGAPNGTIKAGDVAAEAAQ